MKLYYSPSACSQAPHIALREAGLSFTLNRVNKQKRTEDDADFRRINPKGYVPALQFDDGSVLTEVSAILQWIADQVPEKHLAPAAGTMERYQLAEWLNFIATELHKSIGSMFRPSFDDNAKAALKDVALMRMTQAQALLADRPFLVGDHFSVADAYLFNVMSWTEFVAIDLTQFPQLAGHHARVAGRPKVQEALRAEGLVKG
jgi:glutathione S-transferase